eukprot:12274245-Alexandrium_andersonii.AAC.1
MVLGQAGLEPWPDADTGPSAFHLWHEEPPGVAPQGGETKTFVLLPFDTYGPGLVAKVPLGQDLLEAGRTL